MVRLKDNTRSEKLNAYFTRCKTMNWLENIYRFYIFLVLTQRTTVIKRNTVSFFFPQVIQIIHMIVIITGTVWMITDSGPINLEEPTPLTGMEKGTGSEIQERLPMASSLIDLFVSWPLIDFQLIFAEKLTYFSSKVYIAFAANKPAVSLHCSEEICNHRNM